MHVDMGHEKSMCLTVAGVFPAAFGRICVVM